MTAPPVIPAFLFYARDWLTGEGTRLMTPEQKGAFVDLLAHAWMSTPPCTLPDDEAVLAKLSGLHTRWRKAGALVRAQFVRTDDGRLRNRKLWAVYQEMQAFRAARIEAGRRGGLASAAARWGDKQNVTELTANSNGAVSNPVSKSLANGKPASASASTPPTPNGVVGDAPAPARLIDRRGHASHASCGRVCVPAPLHEQFVRQLGGDPVEADARLRVDFYLPVHRQWGPGGPREHEEIGGDGFDFWRARYTEWKPAAPRTGTYQRPAGAKWWETCQHQPPCEEKRDHDLKLAHEANAREEQPT